MRWISRTRWRLINGLGVFHPASDVSSASKLPRANTHSIGVTRLSAPNETALFFSVAIQTLELDLELPRVTETAHDRARAIHPQPNCPRYADISSVSYIRARALSEDQHICSTSTLTLLSKLASGRELPSIIIS